MRLPFAQSLRWFAKRRVVTVSTSDFRPQLERLLVSLERTNPSVRARSYVDDRRAFEDLPVQAEVLELPAIRIQV